MLPFSFLPIDPRSFLIQGRLPIRQLYFLFASDHFLTKINISKNICVLYHDRAVKKSIKTLLLPQAPRLSSISSAEVNERHSLRWFNTSKVLHIEKDIIVPPFPHFITEGDIKWVKKIGERVLNNEVVCTIETDKSLIEVHSPGDGIILSRYVDEGQVVKADDKILRFKFWPDKIEGEENKVEVEPDMVTVPIEGPPPPTEGKLPPSLITIPPNENIYSIRREKKPVEPSPVQIIPKGIPRYEYIVQMTEIKKNIAKRLKQTQSEAALLTYFNEIDMSNVIAFKKAHEEDLKKKFGISLGFMSTFLKAASYALADQPIVNAYIKGSEIVYRNYVDISLGVATPAGLAVPVIRDVTFLNFVEIEKSIKDLTEKAMKGELANDDVTGGTFSINNSGVFGSMLGMPIIDPPQSATLGIHATVERPVVEKGKIVIKPMMYVALTYDHRLIDGREAVLFLKKIKSGVEDPLIMITGL